MNHRSFLLINSEEAIAVFFNHIMKRLSTMRMLCAPDSFHKEESITDFQDTKFCDFCRYETWMHAIVERLCVWRDTIDGYFSEFHGRWKYYAAYHRISAVKESKGEMGGHDGEKSDLADILTDEDYKPYTVLTDLYDEWGRDIVQDTMPDDVRGLCADIVTNSNVDMLASMRKHFGSNIKVYKQAKDGSMRLITQEEHDLDMVSNQVEADDSCKRIVAIVAGVQLVLNIFKTCKYNEDNAELLQMGSDATRSLLNMDFDTLSIVTRKFCERYGEEETAT